MFFDVIFMFQHYIIYPQKNNVSFLEENLLKCQKRSVFDAAKPLYNAEEEDSNDSNDEDEDDKPKTSVQHERPYEDDEDGGYYGH